MMARRSKANWYEPLPPRNWRSNMIPNISRPSSQLSRSLQQSLQESDWNSIRETSSSRSRNSYESPGRLALKKKKTIEQILTKNPGNRPRSVSLTKYEPLPAINAEFPKDKMSSSSSESLSTFDNFEKSLPKRASSVDTLDRLSLRSASVGRYAHEVRSTESGLNRIDSESQEDIDEIEMTSVESLSIVDDPPPPPKLIRSNTFEVIDSTLLNLPVISDDQEESSVSVTVDGIPLLNFIGQASDMSRPSSHSSLITHPGTPDSGFVAQAISSTSSGVLTDSTWQDSDEDLPIPINNEYSFSIVLPDLTLKKSRISLDTSLKDFLAQLSSIQSRSFYVIDQVDEKLLSKSLLKLGFGTIESIRLVHVS